MFNLFSSALFGRGCGLIVSGMMVWAALAGCASQRQSEALSPEVRCARIATTFALATLSKPDADTDIAEALTLAPIVIEEVSTTGEKLAVWPEVVYGGKMTADLAGAPHEQWIYWCSYPSGKDEQSGQPRWCWLRITLDGAGYPVIWETLTSASQMVEVYVSRKLEDLAAERFDGTEKRAAFAVERNLSPDSPVWVMRILDDGPVPMGPMVYVDRSGQVSTVICRCMPSQVKAIADSGFYELQPAQDYPGVHLAPAEDTLFLPRAWFNASPPAQALAKPHFLDDALNLPDGF